MNKQLLRTALFLLLITPGMLRAGGAWTQAKGKAFFKLDQRWISYKNVYTPFGTRNPNQPTSLYSTGFYAEYGITDRITTLFNGVLFAHTSTQRFFPAGQPGPEVAGESLSSVGDMDLGVKYSITKPGSKIPLSATLILGLPTGNNGGAPSGTLQTGDGEFNQLLLIDIGQGFGIGKQSAYAAAHVGFNHRTNGFSEEFRWGFETGAGLFNRRVWTIFRMSSVESLKNGNGGSPTIGLFTNNLEYIAWSIEASVNILEPLGVSFSYAGAIRAENIASAPFFSAGIFYDLNRRKPVSE